MLGQDRARAVLCQTGAGSGADALALGVEEVQAVRREAGRDLVAEAHAGLAGDVQVDRGGGEADEARAAGLKALLPALRSPHAITRLGDPLPLFPVGKLDCSLIAKLRR